MPEKDQEVVEKAQQLAAEYERKCTGCAQSVVAGLLDAVNQRPNFLSEYVIHSKRDQW